MSDKLISDYQIKTLHRLTKLELRKKINSVNITNKRFNEKIESQSATIAAYQEVANGLRLFNELFSDEFVHEDGVWFLDANISEFLEDMEALENKIKAINNIHGLNGEENEWFN